jgi:ferritin-like metal-binding protein YciE
MITNQELSESAQEIMELIAKGNPNKGNLAYALSYLEHIADYSTLAEHAKQYGDSLEYTLKVQCLYALNNLTHWRHTEAKRLRQILKDYTKQY